MGTMTIGAVANAAGVGIETIRYYERTGLLAAPSRKPSGYRQYSPDAVERLAFIKRAQRLGFTLAEVAELVTLHQSEVVCDDMRQRVEAKVAAIDEKLVALNSVRTELLALVADCETACDSHCTVMTGCGVMLLRREDSNVIHWLGGAVQLWSRSPCHCCSRWPSVSGARERSC